MYGGNRETSKEMLQVELHNIYHWGKKVIMFPAISLQLG